MTIGLSRYLSVCALCVLCLVSVSAEEIHQVGSASTILRYPLPTGPGEPLATWNGLKLYPYGPPFVDHVGRFVDSAFTKDIVYPPPRTLRAKGAAVARERNKVYMRMGEHFIAYDLNSFFTSDLGGPLSSAVTAFHTPYPEAYLNWNGEVYPEDSRSGWSTYTLDGQQRLYDFDWDDRGYAYVAYYIWGFGILEESRLATVRQVDWTETATSPTIIASFKSAQRYYLVVGGQTTEIWDVTAPASPFLVRTLGVSVFGASVAQRDGIDIVNLLTKHFDLQLGRTVTTARLYRASDLVKGLGPFQQVSPGTGYNLRSVSTDRSRFFLLENPPTGRSFALHILTPGQDTTPSFEQTTIEYSGMAPTGIRYGDDHLTIWGSDDTRAYDIWLFHLDGVKPVRRDLGDFIRYHYTSQNPPSGYTNASSDGYTGTIYDALFVKHSGKEYLIVSSFGLGDVYELEPLEPLATSGDPNGDSEVSVTDIFYLINYIYGGGSAPVGSGDPDGDGLVTEADIRYLIDNHFLSGPAPR